MPRNYLPTSEPELVRWVNDFHRNLAADPESFGTTVERVAELNTTRERFVSTYEQAGDKLTRTPVVIEQKSIDKRHLINSVRSLVRVLQANPQLTDAQRRALAITVPDRNPTPVGPLTISPLLEVLGMSGRTYVLRLGNVNAPTSRRKPAGARQAFIYVFAEINGQTPPANVMDWKLQEAVGRTEATVTLSPMIPAGTKVWFSACWVNSRNEPGPFSEAVTRHVNFDDLAQAA